MYYINFQQQTGRKTIYGLTQALFHYLIFFFLFRDESG